MGKVVEINAETNEAIEREETAAEAMDRAKLQAEYEAQIASEEAAKKAKDSALTKLAALGLTEDEVASLIR
jgi:hypothetical protein